MKKFLHALLLSSSLCLSVAHASGQEFFTSKEELNDTLENEGLPTLVPVIFTMENGQEIDATDYVSEPLLLQTQTPNGTIISKHFFTGLYFPNSTLTGVIPSSISCLGFSAEVLDFSHNTLQGPIPKEIGLMTFTDTFAFPYNRLTHFDGRLFTYDPEYHSGFKRGNHRDYQRYIDLSIHDNPLEEFLAPNDQKVTIKLFHGSRPLPARSENNFNATDSIHIHFNGGKIVNPYSLGMMSDLFKLNVIVNNREYDPLHIGFMGEPSEFLQNYGVTNDTIIRIENNRDRTISLRENNTTRNDDNAMTFVEFLNRVRDGESMSTQKRA